MLLNAKEEMDVYWANICSMDLAPETTWKYLRCCAQEISIFSTDVAQNFSFLTQFVLCVF